LPKYNKVKAIAAQKKFIKENGGPYFAPRGGVCWKCKRNIYEPFTRTVIDPFGKEKEITTGISVEEAGSRLVTGCPHCHRSYCS